jgi:hypothetical protein
MIEEFKPTRTWDQRIRRHREFQSVVCGNCGFVDNIPCSKFKPLAPEVIVRQMTARKWLMGHKRRDDLCPHCVKQRRSFS